MAWKQAEEHLELGPIGRGMTSVEKGQWYRLASSGEWEIVDEDPNPKRKPAAKKAPAKKAAPKKAASKR